MSWCWGKKIFISNRRHESDNLNTGYQHQALFSDGSSCHPTDCLSRTRSTSTTRSPNPVLLLIGEIGMTWSWVHVHGLISIVFGSLVFIHDPQTNWCPKSLAPLRPGLDLDPILFISWSCYIRLARASTCELWLSISFGELKTGRNSVYYDSDGKTMPFAITGSR